MIAAVMAVGSTAANVRTPGKQHKPVRCQEARRAVAFYRRAFTRWRAAVGERGAQDAIRPACWHIRRAAPAWRAKAAIARAAYERQHAEFLRQYDWQRWLPDKWRRVSVCETGLNWHHQNSQFVSAFGISRRAYDEDARVYGAPPWNDSRNPTPWQQYQAARGHYFLHGGFAGWGCRNA